MYQRILLILERMDPAAETAVKTAVQLAGLHGAPLLGLYVEDLNVLRSAALPLTREISFTTTESTPLSGAGLEQRLRSEAVRLQRLLEAAQQRTATGFSWSFEVRRGLLSEELRRAILPDDLVVMHRALYGSGYPASRNALEAALRTSASYTLLVVGETDGNQTGVLVDSPEDIDAQLSLAISLSRETRTPLVVYLAVAQDEQAQVRDTLEAAAQRLHQPMAFRLLNPARPAEFTRKLGRFHGRALVMSRAGPFMTSESGRRFLQTTHVPLYLVAL